MNPNKYTRLRNSGVPSVIVTSSITVTPRGVVMRKYGHISVEMFFHEVIHFQTSCVEAASRELNSR
jgi:hypothetical protein